MAGVYKKPSDRARGAAGKWTAWWVDEHGKRRKRVAFTDRKKSLELALHLEAEARRVREGLADPGERRRREATGRAVEDHIADYRANLLAKGDGVKHADQIAGALRRLLGSAGVASLADVSLGRVQAALGRMRAPGNDAEGKPLKAKSARTCNHALRALQAFLRWLAADGRIQGVPAWLPNLALYPEESDRKVVRRALTEAELARLIEAAEKGPTFVTRRESRGGPIVGRITGPDRAMCYRIVMATGFRAEEVRTLLPERFRLEGDAPTITVLACYSKRGKRSGRDDVQPIRRDVAELLKPWLATREPGKPVLALPEKTAEMLQKDLGAAGIADRDARGRVVDFHALRHSYITHLVAKGVNPKVVQKLARHSTITLTLDRYTHVEDDDVRDALEK
jgi:integrase